MNREELDQSRSYKVTKSNEMIRRARYDLTITELKLLAYIISKIKPTDTELQEYRISVNDFCQVCGVDPKNGKNYVRIKAILKGLSDKSFWIKDADGHETLVRWLQKARIYRGSGKIEVKLDEDMQRFVIGLFENFTQYELISTLPMKSAYSFRLYELLKSYSYKGGCTIRIEDLKQSMGAEHFTDYRDFRRRALEMAIREINTFTDIEVSWEPETFGRKVEKITFSITQRDAWGRLEAAGRATDVLDGQMSIFDFLEE